MSTVTELAAAIAKLLEQVDADLGALQQQIAALQQQISNKDAVIAALEARIAELEKPDVEEPPPPVDPPPPVAGIKTLAELNAALAAAKGGETLTLADGAFGAFSVNRDFPSMVTVKAANRHKAVFDSISGSPSNITIDGVKVRWTVRFEASTHHVTVQNALIGTDLTLDMDTTGFYNIRTQFVKLLNSDIKGSKYAVIFNEATDFECSGNKIHGARIDLSRFGACRRGKIFNNFLTDAQAVSGDHPDAMQFFGYNGITVGDIHIRGNYIWDNRVTGTTYMQGIFLKDTQFNNILIEENIVCVESPNSIYFFSSDGTPDNIVIRNNTVRSWKNGGGGGMIRIFRDGTDVLVEGNVARQVRDESETGYGDPVLKNNLVHLDTPATDPRHWSKLWQGEPSTWQGSIPVPGSLIDFGSLYGAQARLKELMAS